MSKINVLRSLGILIGMAACLTACSPEEYGPCSIPNTKGHTVACTPTGGSSTATCAVDYVFDCDSLICGIYDSSEAFCTHRCEPSQNECNSPAHPEYCKCPEGKSCKTTCPENGHCVEFIRGTSAYFCMPDDMYKAKGLGNRASSSSSSSSVPVETTPAE